MKEKLGVVEFDDTQLLKSSAVTLPHLISKKQTVITKFNMLLPLLAQLNEVWKSINTTTYSTQENIQNNFQNQKNKT
jgi:hypothetical protein